MLASPVFEKMLTQDMVEKKSGRIELPGKCPKEFKVLLRFLQPITGRRQSITDKNVDFLVQWCDEYCIDSLKDECIEFIKRQPHSMDRLLQAHGLAHPRLNNFINRCISSLLKKGQKDWTKCYQHPELLQKVFEMTMKYFKHSAVPACDTTLLSEEEDDWDLPEG
eukprot:Skav200468  [mRNA]  locus=scaffold5182:5222:5716:- [translate_table: standard]